MMNRNSKWLSFVLALCMLTSMLSLAYAENAETSAAEILALTEEVIATEEAAETEEKSASWTVMIYLCGTDLESLNGMGTTNLEMIKKTTPNDQVNVVIQTGGTESWDHAKEKIDLEIATDKLQRWSYDKDGFTLVDEQELASMAKYSTLADFISWSAENYPAEKNLLVVWDHGGGSSTGLVVDELHDDAIMSLEGLERALKAGGVHFDLFMTDTCLMASLETAQAVQAYADYMLASEEILPGMGSNYEEWLQMLYDEPECGAVRLGRNICNTTELMYAEQNDDANLKGLTFSVIDLNRLEPVVEAFEELMKEVVGLIPDPLAFGAYLSAVSKTDRYAERDMWDLYDLARRSLNGGVSKATALKLENAVDDAVVYCVRGSYHPYSHGLSAFLTYNGAVGKLDRLARTAKNPWQLAFLDAVSLKWDAPELATDKVGEIPQLKPELYTVKFDTEVNKDLSNQLINIYSGIESGGFIRYELQRYDEELKVWYELGESEDVDLISMDDDKLTFAAHFTGRWPAIKGEFLHVTSKDLQGKTVLMQATVHVPFMGERVKKLRILAEYPEEMTYQDEEENKEEAADKDKEETEQTIQYTLEGLWDGYDSSTGLTDRNTWVIAQLFGLELEICKPVYSDYFDNTGDYRYSDLMTIDFDFDVEDTVLPAGQYRMRYSIMDMLDRTYTSDFVNLTWDGEKAVFEAPAEEPENTEEPAA